MERVAILYICTGKYVVFWEDFYKSYEKYFLKKSEVHYYVFTDAQQIYDESNVRVHKIYQERMGWPKDTLMRFAIFSKIKDELMTYDYIFFMNANCMCVSQITEEEFLPVDEGILVVKHPAYYNKNNRKFTYERNKNSNAYIKKGDGEAYVCGGVNGGKSKDYLRLIFELDKRINEDLDKGIIAIWHDESHINRYIIDNKEYKLLSPSFCYPEDWELPFEPKILIRDKSKYIDVDEVKNNKENKRKKLIEFFWRRK